MRTFANPVTIGCFLLFCLNQLLEWQYIFINLIHSYLDDLLCMPLVLTITLATERLYFSNNQFVLPIKYSLVAVLLFSIYFEVVLPSVSPAYTSDVFDVVCYAVGAIIFQITVNRPLTQADNL